MSNTKELTKNVLNVFQTTILLMVKIVYKILKAVWTN